MAIFFQDLRYALRMLAKSPGFTAVAILTLALGIGANSAIFSFVNAVLLRPLPYKDSDRLVFLSERSEQVPDMSIAMANFNDWRASNTVFENMLAYRAEDVVLTGAGEPERLRLREVTAGLFPTLGVKPILGRPLTPEDDKVGASRTVLLSDGFWARKFGRDPQVIGKQLILDGQSYEVIGVIPSSQFHGSWRRFDVFSSLWRLENELGGPANRGSHPGIYAYARMKRGVTIEQARTEMHAVASRIAQQYPDSNSGNGVTVAPLLLAVVEDVRPSLFLLMGAVGFVLLIACANVANLLLARANERQKEISIRRALGAGRWQLVRQLLTESVLLALIGGAMGLLLAAWITTLLASSGIANVPRIENVSVDRWVMIFTLGISILTGLFFGIFPALHSWRANVNEALKTGGRGRGSGTGHQRLRDGLVVAEVAISLMLLVGTGLMIRSMYRVLEADPGFATSHVFTARFSLPEAKYKGDAQRRQFVQQLVDKAKSVPGVEVAGLRYPLLGGWQEGFAIDGRPIPPLAQIPSVDFARITPDALRAMGVRLLHGRFFTEHDNENSQRVCIIDQDMAQQYWPNDDSVGKRIVTELPKPGEQPKWLTVVGVVSHVKNYGVDQPSRVETYVPFAQNPGDGGAIVLRSSSDPAALTAGVREALRSLDPDVPLFNVQTLEDVVGETVAPRRLSVILLSAFAALALTLAAIGIYGVMSYAVSQRTQEFGIRMALGARSGDVLRLVLRSAMLLLIIGAGLGLAGAFYLSRFLQSMLFQVPPTDVWTYVSIIVLLSSVALLACYLPARRATRVDPLVALRYE
jgi:putative ABC transport system permease protein